MPNVESASPAHSHSNPSVVLKKADAGNERSHEASDPLLDRIREWFNMPWMELLWEAHQCHRTHHDPQQIQCAQLMSLKTGGCPEDCAYCPQSAHYSTGLTSQKMQSVEAVKQAAAEAKRQGATRFCMGAAWRSPPEKAMPQLIDIIQVVKSMGLETCMTLGMLSESQATRLKAAGLDFYNHNLDTSPAHYENIISTRTYQDRLETLKHVSAAGLSVCCGGIVGMGETREDRIQWLYQLAKLPKAPESLPINQLIPIPGTPLSEAKKLDPLELVRTIAVARKLFPKTILRLAAGRADMSLELQSLCLFAGIGSLFLGDTLLTADNASIQQDRVLFEALGLRSAE